MNNNSTRVAFFLGGQDLEMQECRKLLDAFAPADSSVHDHQLGWGAKASDYKHEIDSEIAQGSDFVLIELEDDLDLATQLGEERLTLIDHHGSRSGAEAPTAIEQLFEYLALPAPQWTRWRELVAANDRGHIAGMLACNATPEEIEQVRQADRAAQGITPEEEAAGFKAMEEREVHAAGELTVVRLPHARTATVTDPMDPALGGPGYRNLLVLCPESTYFYGSGQHIRSLANQFPGRQSFYGGSLAPTNSQRDYGFWGRTAPMRLEDFIPLFSEKAKPPR